MQFWPGLAFPCIYINCHSHQRQSRQFLTMSAITEGENFVLLQFKENLKDLNLHNENFLFKDTFLIRWLRARDMHLKNAESMFRQHLKWRQENQIDALLEQPMSDYSTTIYPMTIEGFDKWGNVLVFIPFGTVDFKRVLGEFGKEKGMEFFFHYLQQAFTKAVRNSDELALKRLALIIDMRELSYSQFASVEVLDYLLTGVTQFQLHYPEFLAHAFVTFAPYITNILYSIVKPLLDHRTRGKIMFLGSDPNKVRDTLLNYFDGEQLPEKYRNYLI